MKYILTDKGLNKASPTTPHNIKSWNKIKRLLLKKESASECELINVCENHDHPAGPVAYVQYIEKLGWIKTAN